MNPNEIERFKRHLTVDRVLHSTHQEERYFKNKGNYPELHEKIVQDRLIWLSAFRSAVVPVLERQIDRESLSVAVEIGCGTGFFAKYLAPDWLKEKLLSLDINLPSLKTMQKDNKDSNGLLQASTYSLPFKDSSVDVVIGYSSFDSFLWLNRALAEAKRILVPSGKIILFQDLVADLYGVEGDETTGENATAIVERYHALLILEAENTGLRTLEGKETYLNTFGVEKVSEVSKRVTDFETEPRDFPILATWNRGLHRPMMRTQTRQEHKIDKSIIDGSIDMLGKKLRKKNFRKYGASAGDLVTLLKMRYLVLEKFLQSV